MMGSIFTEMVMEEAKKDKLAEYEANQKKDQDEKENQNEASNNRLDDLDSDEDDDFMAQYRAKRLAEMKVKQDNVVDRSHGRYMEIKESEFLDTVTKSQFAVCHFYHNEFMRCKILDEHFKKIAPQHPECKFVYVDADKAPFFVGKLQVRVLPSIVCFKDGVVIDRVVGFEGLGDSDNFPTINLTKRLVQAGVLKPKNKSEKGRITLTTATKQNEDSDDDFFD